MFVESLCIKGPYARGVAFSIRDAAWGELLRPLKRMVMPGRESQIQALDRT